MSTGSSQSSSVCSLVPVEAGRSACRRATGSTGFFRVDAVERIAPISVHLGPDWFQCGGVRRVCGEASVDHSQVENVNQNSIRSSSLPGSWLHLPIVSCTACECHISPRKHQSHVVASDWVRKRNQGLIPFVCYAPLLFMPRIIVRLCVSLAAQDDPWSNRGSKSADGFRVSRTRIEGSR